MRLRVTELAEITMEWLRSANDRAGIGTVDEVVNILADNGIEQRLRLHNYFRASFCDSHSSTPYFSGVIIISYVRDVIEGLQDPKQTR